MNLEIIYNDEPVYRLNPSLVKKQGLTEERLEILKALHVQKLDVFEEMKVTDNPQTLRECADTVEGLEFMMQEAWGFPKDRNFHRWWEVPKCQCPPLDNEDMYGTKYRTTAGNCPIHGGIK